MVTMMMNKGFGLILDSLCFWHDLGLFFSYEAHIAISILVCISFLGLCVCVCVKVIFRSMTFFFFFSWSLSVSCLILFWQKWEIIYNGTFSCFLFLFLWGGGGGGSDLLWNECVVVCFVGCEEVKQMVMIVLVFLCCVFGVLFLTKQVMREKSNLSINLS